MRISKSSVVFEKQKSDRSYANEVKKITDVIQVQIVHSLGFAGVTHNKRRDNRTLEKKESFENKTTGRSTLALNYNNLYRK